ncbi:MAG: PASTA domain-containing protein [Ruminiclostridium sp.]|nr:PASTA domain-containing protein [Ruminiclostridium sp.]
MKKEINRCMGCMSEKLYSGPCEVCGYTDTDAYPAGSLAPKTFLADRYVLGKLLSKGGEGMRYIAFDTKLGITVEIKEFMPGTLCRRGADGESVEVVEGALPLFKSYLSEYADLHKTIMTGFEQGGLKKTFDIFAANGTGYVVSEHINGVTLEEYLGQHGGILSWTEASKLFPPLLDTLAALHEKGIVHRGLSPETILITADDRPVLTSVEISAARTSESRITCKIYDGYAACEQYDLSERQGSWTDVYGFCAVLYRSITGRVPPHAGARRVGDTLVNARRVNDDIPVNVSETIAEGMRINRAERIHDIPELRAKLFGEPAGTAKAADAPVHIVEEEEEDEGPITPTVHVKYDVEEHEEHRRAEEKKKKKKKQERKNFGAAAGFIVFFALVAALVICIIYFSEESQNIQSNTVTAQTTTAAETTAPVTTPRTVPTTTAPVTEPAGEKLLVPNFVNRFYNSSLESRYSLLTFEVEDEYTDEFAEGIIMEQDIPEGTQVTGGTTIHIKVSKGPAFTYLPDYTGMKLSDYTNKLQTLGVRYDAVPEETNEVKAGYVVRCSKNIGDRVYISENEGVTVYYAVRPAATEAVTETPETEPAGDDDGEEEIIEE